MSSSGIDGAFHDVSETFFYWCLIKISPRIALVVLSLPCAIMLVARAGNLPSTPSGQFASSTGLAIIAFVGIHTLQAPKLDSFAFLQLCFATVLKTLQHFPTITLACKERFATSIDSSRALFRYMEKSLDHVPATPSVALRLGLTLIIYIIDGLSQWPNRWSTLGRYSLPWGAAVLIVRGTMVLVDDGAQESTADGLEEASVTSLDMRYKRCKSQCLRHYLSVFLAVVIVCMIPLSIDIGSDSIRSGGILSKNDTTTLYFAALIACGLALYFYHIRWDMEKPTYKAIGDTSSDETTPVPHRVKRTSWLNMLLSVSAIAPLFLAAGKHAMSGSQLQSIYVALGRAVSIRIKD